jgi:hypothetical protein
MSVNRGIVFTSLTTTLKEVDPRHPFAAERPECSDRHVLRASNQSLRQVGRSFRIRLLRADGMPQTFSTASIQRRHPN